MTFCHWSVIGATCSRSNSRRVQMIPARKVSFLQAVRDAWSQSIVVSNDGARPPRKEGKTDEAISEIFGSSPSWRTCRVSVIDSIMRRLTNWSLMWDAYKTSSARKKKLKSSCRALLKPEKSMSYAIRWFTCRPMRVWMIASNDWMIILRVS